MKIPNNLNSLKSLNEQLQTQLDNLLSDENELYYRLTQVKSHRNTLRTRQATLSRLIRDEHYLIRYEHYNKMENNCYLAGLSAKLDKYESDNRID